MAHRTSENSFVMVRPGRENDNLIVENIGSYQDKQDLIALYENSFGRFFIDYENKMPKALHKKCLNSVLPTVSLIVFHEMEGVAESIKDDFLSSATKSQKETFESFPDQESGFNYILSEKMREFKSCVKKEGLDSAIMQNEIFFVAIKKVYYELPVMFIFNLIDVVGI